MDSRRSSSTNRRLLLDAVVAHYDARHENEPTSGYDTRTNQWREYPNEAVGDEAPQLQAPDCPPRSPLLQTWFRKGRGESLIASGALRARQLRATQPDTSGRNTLHRLLGGSIRP